MQMIPLQSDHLVPFDLSDDIISSSSVLYDLDRMFPAIPLEEQLQVLADNILNDTLNIFNEDRHVPRKRYSSSGDCSSETSFYPQDYLEIYPAVDPSDVFQTSSSDSTESQVSSRSSASPAYCPGHDHSYSMLTKQFDVENLRLNCEKSRTRFDSSSDSSSECEVDVVTIPEELPPNMPSSRRNTQCLNHQKGPKKIKKGQTAIFKSERVPVQRTRTVRTCRQPKKGSSIPSNLHNYLDREDSLKRKEHNTSERQRRQAQKTALQNLRLCIPELVKSHKAAKVHILNSASTYIHELKQEHEVIMKDRQKEEKTNRALQRKLKKLLKSTNPEIYEKILEEIMRKIKNI